MIPLSVPEIEGGSPERDGGGEGEEEEEGLVWADSSSWDIIYTLSAQVICHTRTCMYTALSNNCMLYAGQKYCCAVQ